MKKILIILPLFCLIFSCSKSQETIKVNTNSWTQTKTEKLNEDLDYISKENQDLINSLSSEVVLKNLDKKINSKKADLNDYLTYLSALLSDWYDKKVTNDNLEKWLEIIKNIEPNYPQSSELKRVKWYILSLKWEENEAIKYLEEAIKINPKNSYALSNLAYSYKEIWNLEKAKEYLNKALEIDNLNYQANFNLALLNYEQKNYKETVNILTKIIENYENKNISVKSLILRAQAYEGLQEYINVETDYETAIWLNAINDEIYQKYWIYNYNFFARDLETNEANAKVYLERAKGFFKKALELNPKSAETSYLLWLTYFYSEENDLATKNFKNTLELLESDNKLSNKEKSDIQSKTQEKLNYLTE